MGRINVTSVFLWGASPNDSPHAAPRHRRRRGRRGRSTTHPSGKEAPFTSSGVGWQRAPLSSGLQLLPDVALSICCSWRVFGRRPPLCFSLWRMSCLWLAVLTLASRVSVSVAPARPATEWLAARVVAQVLGAACHEPCDMHGSWRPVYTHSWCCYVHQLGPASIPSRPFGYDQV